MTNTITVRNIAAEDIRAAGYWTSADNQGSMDMTCMTLAEAKAELLSQCGDAAGREVILDGEIEIAA